jgi:hypothetical protein
MAALITKQTQTSDQIDLDESRKNNLKCALCNLLIVEDNWPLTIGAPINIFFATSMQLT